MNVAIIGKKNCYRGAELVSIDKAKEMVFVAAKFLKLKPEDAWKKFEDAGYNVFNNKWKIFVKEQMSKH